MNIDYLILLDGARNQKFIETYDLLEAITSG
jgi:hypothetical protein